MMILLNRGPTTTRQRQSYYWPVHLVEFPWVFVKHLSRVIA